MLHRCYPIGELADKYGVNIWVIQRLINHKKVPAEYATRRLRVISEHDIPTLERELRLLNYDIDAVLTQ